MEKYYLIKQVSQATGLSSSNIRYYEKEGLISSISRNNNGVRIFSEKDIVWIKFLYKLKDMEMSLPLMKQYALLRKQGNKTIQQRILILEKHKQALQAKIQHLHLNITLLDNKILTYQEMENDNNG